VLMLAAEAASTFSSRPNDILVAEKVKAY